MTRALSLFASLLAATIASAADWPQWMGPNRDDVWPEIGILDKFPEGGPKVLWRKPVNGGFAGPAVANGKVYVTDYLRAAGDDKPAAARWGLEASFKRTRRSRWSCGRPRKPHRAGEQHAAGC